MSPSRRAAAHSTRSAPTALAGSPSRGRPGAVRADAGAWQCEEPPGDTDHPALRISYDERLDFLTALVPGEVVDEPYDEELMTAFAWREDDESGRPASGPGCFTVPPAGR